jgi:hypothetical protein
MMVDYKAKHDYARDDAVRLFRAHMRRLYGRAGIDVADQDVVEWKDVIEYVIDAATFRAVALVAELSPEFTPPRGAETAGPEWVDLVIDRRADGVGWTERSWPRGIPVVLQALSWRARKALRDFVAHDPYWEKGQRPRTFRMLLELPHREFRRRRGVGYVTIRDIVVALRALGIEWKQEGGFDLVSPEKPKDDVPT